VPDQRGDVGGRFGVGVVHHDQRPRRAGGREDPGVDLRRAARQAPPRRPLVCGQGAGQLDGEP
jgi:hypothetical protein